MNTEQYHRLRILHVEDNVGDVRLIAEAVRETGRDHEIAVAFDGVEALDYLYRRGRYADAWRPELILLDLNLQRRAGSRYWRRSTRKKSFGNSGGGAHQFVGAPGHQPGLCVERERLYNQAGGS